MPRQGYYLCYPPEKKQLQVMGQVKRLIIGGLMCMDVAPAMPR